MVSIILPFYNAEDFISDAINSVLGQEYQNWELIIINDGSEDNSKNIVQSFKDTRIQYFEQENQGVSSARNLGLRKMKGAYFCFLDADDIFPKNSIATRNKYFLKNKNVDFVDGSVHITSENPKNVITTWKPRFQGNPFKDLLKLSGKSFLGQTWMVKRKENITYQFNEELTHNEDLLFYLELSEHGGIYGFVNEPILLYRKTLNSAMADLKGLETGYRYIGKKLRTYRNVSKFDQIYFTYKYKRSMFLSYLNKGMYVDSIKSLL
jgi:teichuronic acid biosynthesis glycosyltransferase TuaG